MKDFLKLLDARIAAVRAFVSVTKANKIFNEAEKEREKTEAGYRARRNVNVEKWKGIDMNSPNPYIERGELVNRPWKSVARTDAGMKSFIDVTEMMTHVMWANDRFYRGTSREGCWRAYHDGLTTWMAVDAQEFLKTLKNEDGSTPLISFYNRQVIISRWSNEDPRMAKTYKSKITGNRHEKNPLDTQLFASVNSDLVMNMVATKQLPDSDPRKFAFDKYAVAFRSLERVLSKLPMERIFQDVDLWKPLHTRIVAEKGCKLFDNKQSGMRSYYDKKGGMKKRMARMHDCAKSALHDEGVLTMNEDEAAALEERMKSEEETMGGEMERMEVTDVDGGGGGGEGEEDWDGEFVGLDDLQVAGGE